MNSGTVSDRGLACAISTGPEHPGLSDQPTERCAPVCALSPGVVHDRGVIQVGRGQRSTAKILNAQPAAVSGATAQIGRRTLSGFRQANHSVRPTTRNCPDRGEGPPDRLGDADGASRVHAVGIACHSDSVARTHERRRAGREGRIYYEDELSSPVWGLHPATGKQLLTPGDEPRFTCPWQPSLVAFVGMGKDAPPNPSNLEPRRFGQLPGLFVPQDFDAPLPDVELAEWLKSGPATYDIG